MLKLMIMKARMMLLMLESARDILGWNLTLKENAEFLEQLWENIPGMYRLGKHGSTGYIDFLTPKDLADQPLVKGMDPHGRKFIAFLVDIERKGKKTEEVVTVFQRYRDNPIHWAHAGEADYALGSHGEVDILKVCRLMMGSVIDSSNAPTCIPVKMQTRLENR